jgi:hypothetical protein
VLVLHLFFSCGHIKFQGPTWHGAILRQRKEVPWIVPFQIFLDMLRPPASSVVTYRPAILLTGVFGSDSPTITFTTDYQYHDGGNEKFYGSGTKVGRKYLIYFASIFDCAVWLRHTAYSRSITWHWSTIDDKTHRLASRVYFALPCGLTAFCWWYVTRRKSLVCIYVAGQAIANSDQALWASWQAETMTWAQLSIIFMRFLYDTSEVRTVAVLFCWQWRVLLGEFCVTGQAVLMFLIGLQDVTLLQCFKRRSTISYLYFCRYILWNLLYSRIHSTRALASSAGNVK